VAHQAQQEFCERVRARLPEYFTGTVVLDCGSLDVNGSNASLFRNVSYTGVDIGPGRNVDLVSPIHEVKFKDGSFDVVVSTECFEHDKHYAESLRNIVRMLRPGGLFFFTCATTGRAEHGTRRAHPGSSPLTANRPGWRDYYKNLTEADIRAAIDLSEFEPAEFSVNDVDKDLYFWGVKRGSVTP
jgi:SAM-dependent methyltransferase